jgi:Family of unknown function (DUF6049)
VTESRIPKQVCRRATCAALLAIVLLAIALLPTLLPTPLATAAHLAPSTATVVAPSPTVTVSLSAITPSIVLPKVPVTITGSVRNAGQVPIDAPLVRALIGQRPVTSRIAISDWETSDNERPMTEVTRSSPGTTLAPGAVAPFVLTIPATAISHRDSFAVLPLRVEVVGTRGDTTEELSSLHTFLPTLSATKAYEPLSIAWLVPLTLDPDPALHGMDSPARTAAWIKAIGPGSRLDKLMQGTDGTNATWAIDPAILGPRPIPDVASPSPTPTPTSNPPTAPPPVETVTPDPVTEATTALASRLRAAVPRHTLWSLPYADPDLAAVLPLTSGPRALSAVINAPSTLSATVGRTRADIAWPVEGTVTPQSETGLRQAFGTPGIAAAVTSASTLTSRNGSTGNATRKSSGGLPLLAYDEALSRTVAQTSSKATAAVAIQRFLADSLALLGERPGTLDRSVLVALPRTFAADPTALHSLFAVIADAPWLTPTTTEQLLDAATGLVPEPPSFGRAGPTETPGQAGVASTPTAPPTADPLNPGTSPITPTLLAGIPAKKAAVSGLASIQDGALPFQVRWTDAQDQLLSVRWRGNPRRHSAVNAATSSAITTISRSVSVAPSSVNFFADRGVLQVTVVNDLAVPIHDVRLRLTPGQPRLRIEQQPGPLRIGAKSRTNVPLQVTALAAGLVPVKAVLTTPNGTPLGQNARVDVRVQPTSTWIYWALGGLASLVLVLGIFRSLRRGSTRASRPAAPELSLPMTESLNG